YYGIIFNLPDADKYEINNFTIIGARNHQAAASFAFKILAFHGMLQCGEEFGSYRFQLRCKLKILFDDKSNAIRCLISNILITTHLDCCHAASLSIKTFIKPFLEKIMI